MTVVQLRAIAKKRGDIARISTLKKAQLVAALERKADSTSAPKIAKALALGDYEKARKALVGVKTEELRSYPRRPRGVTASMVKQAKDRKAVIVLLLPGSSTKASSGNMVALLGLVEEDDPATRREMIKGLSKSERTGVAGELGVPAKSSDRTLEAAVDKLRKNGERTDLPCPNIFGNFIARQKPLTKAQLGVYAGVKDCLYPYAHGSAEDRRFLAGDEDSYIKPKNVVAYNTELIRRLADQESVKRMCFVDPVRHEMLMLKAHVTVDENIDIGSMEGLVETLKAFPARVAREAHVDVHAIVQALQSGVIHNLNTSHLKGIVQVAVDDGERGKRTMAWVARKELCDKDEKPWLPILLGSWFGEWGHVTVLLLNRRTGVAYYFEPNGGCGARDGTDLEDTIDQNTLCLGVALATIPLARSILKGNMQMPNDEWTATRVVTLPGELGPQIRQSQGGGRLLGNRDGTCSVWSHLFIHLFMLHPELEPDELMARMLAPAQRPHLATIISRYSMFLAELGATKKKRK